MQQSLIVPLQYVQKILNISMPFSGGDEQSILQFYVAGLLYKYMNVVLCLPPSPPIRILCMPCVFGGGVGGEGQVRIAEGQHGSGRRDVSQTGSHDNNDL